MGTFWANELAALGFLLAMACVTTRHGEWWLSAPRMLLIAAHWPTRQCPSTAALGIQLAVTLRLVAKSLWWWAVLAPRATFNLAQPQPPYRKPMLGAVFDGRVPTGAVANPL